MQGDPISPLNFLITLLIILNQINTAHSEDYSNDYWDYFPDPPLLQPVGWEGQSIPIYTNDTVALGGFSDKHIIPLFLIILTVLFLAPCLIKKLMIYG